MEVRIRTKQGQIIDLDLSQAVYKTFKEFLDSLKGAKEEDLVNFGCYTIKFGEIVSFEKK